MSTYDGYRAPKNTPLWAFKYWFNSETGYKEKYMPIMGEIADTPNGLKFVPYKQGTKEKRSTGCVGWENKRYADTKEEAIIEYNKYVQMFLEHLRELIKSAESDIITKQISIKTREPRVFKWISSASNDSKIDSPPIDTAIWAFAYHVNNLSNNAVIKCQPTFGEIKKRRASLLVSEVFAPYKKGKKGELCSSKTSASARLYTMTEDEAILGYNSLVQQRIAKLNDLLLSLENDMI